MWASLRSDLREFVSSVADDSSKVLHTIDSKMVEAENAVMRNTNIEEAHTNTDEKLILAGEGELASWALDEADKRMCLIDTYTQDLFSVSFSPNASSESMETEENNQGSQEYDDVSDEDDLDASEFLSCFDIDAKTDEIASILESNSMVQQHFETLVPIVITYEQFWQRYFFRCDPERIQKQWDAEEERIRQERRQLIVRGVSNVKNLLGGALKALHTTVARSSESTMTSDANQNNKDSHRGANIYEKYQAQVEEQKRALSEGRASAHDIFLGSSRPPFVLNTAESGDDDVDHYHDPKKSASSRVEEDEDIGWGSDDDEDIDVDDDLTEGKSSREHSDLVNSSVDPSSDQVYVSPTTEFSSSHGEIQRLLSVLLDKEKEITALKASLEMNPKESTIKSEYEELIKSHARENEIFHQKNEGLLLEIQKINIELQDSIASKTRVVELHEVATRELEETKLLISQLKANLQQSLDVAHSESKATDALTTENSRLKLEMEKFCEINVEAHKQIDVLMTSLNEMKCKDNEARNRIIELEAEMEKMNSELQSLRAKGVRNPINTIHVDESPPVSNASSISSVVKVTSPKSQEASVVDEDDWGDSWGEGDD